MASMSDYLEQQILNHIFRNTAIFTPPANVYLALFTAAPSDSGGGTEVSGGSYVRKTVSTTTQWNAPGVGGLTDNINAQAFVTATANWGTITHVGIFDAASAGNLLFHGALTTSKVVNNGDTFQFNAGDFDITLA